MPITRLGPGMFRGLWTWLLLAEPVGCDQKIELQDFGSPPVEGSGVARTEKREVRSFAGIEVGGIFKLDLTVGKEVSLEVSGDDNLIPLVITEVTGDVLKIHSMKGLKPRHEILVRATTPTLRTVATAGASHASLRGIHEKQFRADSSGSSRCELAGHAEQLGAVASGGSRLSGTELNAERASLETSGSSDVVLKAGALEKASLEGGAKVVVSGLEGGRSRIEASGSSRLDVSGRVEQLAIAASGGATVNGHDLKATTVTLEASGSSEIVLKAGSLEKAILEGGAKVNVSGLESGRSRIEASGSSHIDVSGRAAQVSIDASAGSTVNARGLKAQVAVVHSSGSSKVEVTASESLDVDASGGSSVRYGGSPARKTFNKSGSASIQP